MIHCLLTLSLLAHVLPSQRIFPGSRVNKGSVSLQEAALIQLSYMVTITTSFGDKVSAGMPLPSSG